jgi:hydrogenase nickel incorporation protein HypB
MCKDCGCGNVENFAINGEERRNDASRLASLASPAAMLHDHPDEHEHSHEHGHTHEHRHAAAETRTLDLRANVLDKNDRLAERNRGYFIAKGLFVLNVLSSPGSGKTTFLEQTIRRLNGRVKSAVVVGDLETDNDARRLRETGVEAVQITTGTVCHLDAEMIARAVGKLNLDGVRLLFVENVGNLVCPASYDLGEDVRVAILSVTEGEDKPLKYPVLFKSAHVVVINKTDIADAVGFDRQTAMRNLRNVAPQARIFEVSARTGDGMDEWVHTLEHGLEHARLGS